MGALSSRITCAACIVELLSANNTAHGRMLREGPAQRLVDDALPVRRGARD